MKTGIKQLTDVELEFMQLLWQNESMTTEVMQKEFSARGRDLADGSIRKILSILLKKGYVKREKVGRGFEYTPKIKRQHAQQNLVQDFLGKTFGGSARNLVATLLDTENISHDELLEIQEMIRTYERRAEK